MQDDRKCTFTNADVEAFEDRFKRRILPLLSLQTANTVVLQQPR